MLHLPRPLIPVSRLCINALWPFRKLCLQTPRGSAHVRHHTSVAPASCLLFFKREVLLVVVSWRILDFSTPCKKDKADGWCLFGSLP